MRNFPLGLCLGSILTLLFCAAFDSAWISTDNPLFLTVISGLFVFSASGLATLGVLSTIENTRELADTASARKLTAARAALPLALNELTDLCDSYVEYIANGCLGFKGNKILSETSQQTIQLVIEYADQEAQERLSNLVKFYQVSIARSQDSSNFKVDWTSSDPQVLYKIKAAYRIADWTAIRCLAGEFYEYSRRNGILGKREGSRRLFERYVSDVSLSSGWLLTNDRTFSNYFDLISENKESSFFKPDFFRVD